MTCGVVDQAAREWPTAHIPWSAAEIRWARRRPAPHRTPLPAVGDQVYYRHDPWTAAVAADVLAVQSLTDVDDPNLWQFVTERTGALAGVEGRRILAQAYDPNPTVTLRTPFGTCMTREARMRGEPGWLPLDWQRRWRPYPRLNGGCR